MLQYTYPPGNGQDGADGGLIFTAVKTANYQAVAGEMVRCNTSGGAFTVTVPAAPVADQRFGVILTTEAAAQANLLTVSAGSGPHDNKLYCQGDYIIYQYDGAAWQTAECYLKPHCARLTREATQALDTATLTTIALDTEAYDVGGAGDVANGRVTIRRAGRYLVTGSGGISNLSANEYLRVDINVGADNFASSKGESAGGGNISQVTSIVLDLAAAAQVKLQMVHIAGQTENTMTGNFVPTLTIAEIR